jgi:hypothetical protein
VTGLPFWPAKSGGQMNTDAPTFRINPEVLEGIAPLPGIDRLKVEMPAPSWVVLILQALAENRLKLEISFKSIAGHAEGPVAIAAFVMVMMAVLAVVVSARATDHPPSRSFEQLWTTRVASEIEQQGGKEHE